MFEEMGLCDVENVQIVPTWRSFRSRRGRVSKRINKFMVVEKLLEELE